MKMLVIGSGGREHALIWKLRESQRTNEIYCAPGNAGISPEAECVPADLSHPQEILEVAKRLEVDLTVVGPEAPLVAGLVDEFEKEGLAIIGPTRAAARLEGSKIFAKQFMERHHIPTPRFSVAGNFEEALREAERFGMPVVIKADGLAAGKGVAIVRTRGEAARVLDELMRQRTLGSAGASVVIEECLVGEEVSFIVLTDGRTLLPFPPAQDHKPVFDNDQGPNTGGMGAYSDDSLLSERWRSEILRRIVTPTLEGMAAEGAPYRGFLYCGLMLTDDGPKVLEYNVRLGDPEAQPLLMRLRSDLVEILLASSQEQLGAVEARWSPNPSLCVVLASAGYPGPYETGKLVSGYEAAEALGGVKVFHAGTRFVEHQLITSGGRVLGVTAMAQDLPSTIQRAYAAVAKIHFEGMHYRRDIGAKGLERLPRSLKSARTPKGNPSRSKSRNLPRAKL